MMDMERSLIPAQSHTSRAWEPPGPASPAPLQGTQFPKKGGRNAALMTVASRIRIESKSGF